MITPNQRLTKVDSVTIPSLHKRAAALETQLSQITTTASNTKSSMSAQEKTRLEDAEKMTKGELKYVKSYLRIMETLKDVTSCEGKDSDCYDYEKEDDILDKIAREMKELKVAEKEVVEVQRRYSGCDDGDMCVGKLVDDLKDAQIGAAPQ